MSISPKTIACHVRNACAARLLLLLLVLPAVVQAQYDYIINNGTITITRYNGSGGVVTIPSEINGLPVTGIGDRAFSATGVSSVTIPSTVTSIGTYAFYDCRGLTNVPTGNGVTNIGAYAFAYCRGLTSVTIPDSVTSIGRYAFTRCDSLTGVYFQGNWPNVDQLAFLFSTPTLYYLPGTTGWGPSFAGRPAVLWSLPNPVILKSSNFGVQTNGFGFIISWATNASVVVEACTDLVNPAWSPVGTNILAGGSSYFSDPQWTNHPNRFYRLRSP